MAKSQNKKSRQSIDPEYYEVPHELITIFVVLALGFVMPVVLYAPHWLPSGPIGKFLLYLGTDLRAGFFWLYYVALATHAAESAVAVLLCRKLGLTGPTTLKWFANTAVHGGFALKFLIGKARRQDAKSV